MVNTHYRANGATAMPLFIRLNPRSCILTVQLMNIIVINLILHCSNCDANRALVTIRESTAAGPSSGLYLMQNLRLRGRPHQSFSHA